MLIVSFNVNGVRARLPQLQALVDHFAPDILALQETKVADAQFPSETFAQWGYHSLVHGQKGHFGVALLSRQPPQQVIYGPESVQEQQKRLLAAAYPLPGSERPLWLLNGYFPQGENRSHPTKFPAKETFYRGLRQWLDQHFSPQQPLLAVGDMNVAPRDEDVGIGAENARRWLRDGKCSFLPEERQWLQELLAFGLSDLYALQQPDTPHRYSWFDYRSRGFEKDPKRGLRIDLLLGSQPVQDRVQQVGIDYQLRGMPRPSDHCPVWVSLTDAP